MSAATNNLKWEIKELLCRLLKIPNDGKSKDIDVLIEKILLCATLESHFAMRGEKPNGTTKQS